MAAKNVDKKMAVQQKGLKAETVQKIESCCGSIDWALLLTFIEKNGPALVEALMAILFPATPTPAPTPNPTP